MSKLNFAKTSNQKSLDLFETQDISSKFLKGWFFKRGKYLFGHRELVGIVLQRKLFIGQMNYPYENMGVIPYSLRMTPNLL